MFRSAKGPDLPVLSGAAPAGEARTGCLSCGAEIVYLAAAEAMTCAGCGAVRESAARCAAGHYFCDACHSGSADDAIVQTCLAWTGTDPVALAVAAMRHPTVKMHGPEHHFLVPAVLATVWCNARGEPGRKAALVAEARRRAAPVAGGFCGFQGACGAAIGAGIFASLATGATPLSREPWQQANRLTSEALALVASAGGPRCCKRDTFLALLAAARFARRHLGTDLRARGTKCGFRELNRECTAERCPFHR